MSQSTPGTQRVDLLGCDPDSMYECMVLTFGGDLAKTWDSFNLNLAVKQMLYTPPEGEYRPGEQGSMSFSLGATMSFEFGGSLSVNAESIQMIDYRKEVTPEMASLTQDAAEPEPAKELAQATGQAQKLSASFSLSPLEWLTGKVSFEQYSASFGLSDANHAKDFEEKTVMDRQTFSLQVVLSKTF